jgi:pimeloyl-ACP methyl ester carboxylesterase
MPLLSDLKAYLYGLFGSLAADNLASAPAPPSPTSRTRLDNDNSDTFLLPDGRKLGYAQHGCQTGRAILFMHGHPGSRLEGAHLHDLGLTLGARIITPDRPGTGWSSPHPGRTLLDYPRDLEYLADHLKLESYGVLVGAAE